MKYDIILSEEAHSDVDSVLHYIVNVLKNPTAAKNLLDKIEKVYTDIANNPFMYAYCNNSRLQNDEYRKVVINHYVLIYRVDEAKNTVFVVRLFYGRQNYIALI
ncbi:type II toxin-antitoxin system RelE/ParE family toxin [Ructibacterium gallinarum]|uniref:Type II toxin-antitoxin system RelE/ParE family toxin n=1 Tax=Ructibacterium gallinarum TaxID=2779355 RepID=A0A9D5LZ81_9FIRM|nr:type II toxin-antitoxin system RelE/ParE family toxin [Ructibacterium gallinarum]MBE5040771.1 type II toxin-antitoxin system RelE/ParE family toxin [Ructibacterium gallinarum]